jgi:hypothetical protein
MLQYKNVGAYKTERIRFSFITGVKSYSQYTREKIQGRSYECNSILHINKRLPCSNPLLIVKIWI